MTFRTFTLAPATRLVARTATVAALALLLPAAASAQGKGRGPAKVPPGHLPAAGECRVWYEGRPPGQQPAPTDCATAESVAARTGGRVLYGDVAYAKRKGGDKSRRIEGYEEGRARSGGKVLGGRIIDPATGKVLRTDGSVKAGKAPKGTVYDAKGTKGTVLKEDKEAKSPKKEKVKPDA